jgi:phospholipid N-methyltransferase
MRFLKGFIEAPNRVGSIVPSSRELASVVVKSAKAPDAGTVVEFGPGTGAITERLLELLRPDAKLIAMEINPDFVRLLKKRFPNLLVFNDSAAKTPEYLAKIGETCCDSIVSGLPWTNFSDELQNELLDAAVASLCPGGTFATYTYIHSQAVPSGRKFRLKLEERFSRTGETKIVWKNVPPAIVLWAEK